MVNVLDIGSCGSGSNLASVIFFWYFFPFSFWIFELVLFVEVAEVVEVWRGSFFSLSIERKWSVVGVSEEKSKLIVGSIIGKFEESADKFDESAEKFGLKVCDVLNIPEG
jgi:hypothetical protein